MYICICIFLNLYIDYTLILHLTKCQCVYNHQIPKKMGLPLPTNSPGSSAVSAQHVSQPKRNHFFPEDKLEPHLSRALKLRGYVAIKKWKFLIYINMYIYSNNPIYIISYMCIYIYLYLKVHDYYFGLTYLKKVDKQATLNGLVCGYILHTLCMHNHPLDREKTGYDTTNMKWACKTGNGSDVMGTNWGI